MSSILLLRRTSLGTASSKPMMIERINLHKRHENKACMYASSQLDGIDAAALSPSPSSRLASPRRRPLDHHLHRLASSSPSHKSRDTARGSGNNGLIFIEKVNACGKREAQRGKKIVELHFNLLVGIHRDDRRSRCPVTWRPEADAPLNEEAGQL